MLSRALAGLTFLLRFLVLYCKHIVYCLLCLPASDDVSTRPALCPRYTAHSPNSHWVSDQPCTWPQWRTSRDLVGAADIHRWPHPKRAHRHWQHRWSLAGCSSTVRKFWAPWVRNNYGKICFLIVEACSPRVYRTIIYRVTMFKLLETIIAETTRSTCSCLLDKRILDLPSFPSRIE